MGLKLLTTRMVMAQKKQKRWEWVQLLPAALPVQMLLLTVRAKALLQPVLLV